MIAIGASAIDYTYDELNRLTRVVYDDGSTIDYTYDAAGNRLSRVVTEDRDGVFYSGGTNPCVGGNAEACEDNCSAVANADQADSDGDGIGDACECGDASGDGAVNTIDARLIQRCAVGELPCSDLCDVTGEGACNTIDARIIQRLAVGELTKEDLRCAARP